MKHELKHLMHCSNLTSTSVITECRIIIFVIYFDVKIKIKDFSSKTKDN